MDEWDFLGRPGASPESDAIGTSRRRLGPPVLSRPRDGTEATHNVSMINSWASPHVPWAVTRVLWDVPNAQWDAWDGQWAPYG